MVEGGADEICELGSNNSTEKDAVVRKYMSIHTVIEFFASVCMLRSDATTTLLTILCRFCSGYG